MANIQKRGENSWLFSLYTGKDAFGKYIRKTRTIKVLDESLLKTKKRLQDYLDNEFAKFKQEIEAGEYISPEKMTFTAFVEVWKVKYAKEHLQARTLENYMYHINNRLIPAFGHMRLDAIKTIQILNFIEGLAHTERLDNKEGSLSSGSIQYIHRTIKNIFSRAVEWKIIKTSPVDGVKKPRVIRGEMEVYSREEVDILIAALNDEPINWKMMIILAVTTGLRRGELLGLDWKNVDLDNGTIDVRQTLSSSKNNRYLIKQPKTKSSLRKVTLPTSILAELKSYKAHCNKERMKTVDLWEGGQDFFVFSMWNGKPTSPFSVDHFWRKFLVRAKLKHIRFHDLRHTSATLLLNQGVHAKIISSRLGHANITTTLNIYAHALQEADQAAADKFDSLFTPKAEKKQVK